MNTRNAFNLFMFNIQRKQASYTLTSIFALVGCIRFSACAQPMKGLPGHTENTIAYSAESMGMKGKVKEVNELVIKDKDTIRIGRLYDEGGLCTIAMGDGMEEQHKYRFAGDTLYHETTVYNQGNKYHEVNVYLYTKKLLLRHSSDKPLDIIKSRVYDSKGYVIAEYDTVIQLGHIWRYTFQNDEQGHLLMGKCYENDSLVQTTTCQYKDSLIIGRISLGKYKRDTAHIYKMDYDAANRLVRDVDISRKFETSLIKEYKYNDAGITTRYIKVYKSRAHSAEPYIDSTSEVYSDFDGNGNWKKKLTIENLTERGNVRQTSETTIREIKYY